MTYWNIVKNIELEIKIRFLGFNNKQFASLLGVHYQTVIGWLKGRTQVSVQAIALLDQLEGEFDKAFESSYRFLVSKLDERARCYRSVVYIPILKTMDDYKRYGTLERNPIHSIEFYQLLALSVCRAWKTRKNTDAYTIVIDSLAYEQWCLGNNKDFMIDSNLIQWMQNEVLKRDAAWARGSCKV